MLRAATYRSDIQVLRGIAVIVVVLFHADETYFPLGYLGVDVFFVISGFVVTPLILRIFQSDKDIKNRFYNLKNFYKRRFFRLAPALAATLALSAILIFSLGPISDHQRFAQQGIATLLMVGNIGAHKYSGNYFSPNPNPLVHTWSLSVEEQIYFFIPIFLMLILYRQSNLKKNTTIAFGCISVLSFFTFLFPKILQPFYSWMNLGMDTQFSFYSPTGRIWQFTLGGLGYLMMDGFQSRFRSISRATCLMVTISLIALLVSALEISTSSASILASLLAVFAILLKSLEALPKILSTKLEWIGDRSYSIYLVHMPILYIFKYSAMTAGAGQGRALQTIFGVVASVLVGAVSYSKIENRFRFIEGKNLESKQKPLTWFLAIFLIPLGFFLIIMKAPKFNYWGLDVRYPKVASAGDFIPSCTGGSVPINNTCTSINTKSPKTALLIGDSHAGHISLSLTSAAIKNNWKLIYLEYPLEKLDESPNHRFETLIRKTKPDLLVISQYWRKDSNQLTIRNKILELKTQFKNVLLVENNPIFPDFSRFWLAGYVLAPFEFPKFYPRTEMDVSDRATSDELATWARSQAISTMNFEKLFCDINNCHRYSKRGWLYTDTNHLSLAGAELTVREFDDFLQSLR